MFHISVGDTGFLHQNLVENPLFRRLNGTTTVREFKYCCVKLGFPLEVKVTSIRPWTSNPWGEYGTFTKEVIMLAFSRSEDEVYLPFSEELLEVGIWMGKYDYTWTVMGKQFTPKRDGYV